MRIALLSRGRGLYSTRRLVEAGKRRGHDVRVIDPFECSLVCGEEGGARHPLTRLDTLDCVIPRTGGASADMVINLLAQLEHEGVRALNGADAIARCRDKFRSLQSMAAAGLPVPRTAMTRMPEQLDACILAVGGPPAVVKLREGTQGVGVMKVDSMTSARSVVQALWSLEQPVLIQEFIAEAAGSDLRVFVVEGRVVGAMTRQADGDDFRSNLHMGGQGQRAALTPAMRELALAACAHFNLQVGGVDLLLSERGPLITEVNPSPGLEGIEGVTGLDIAKAIIRAAERLVSVPDWTPPVES